MTLLINATTHFQYEGDVSPRDQSENSFWFAIPGLAPGDEVGSIILGLQEFYTTSNGIIGHDHSLQEYFPDYINLGSRSTTIRVVDEPSGVQVGGSVLFGDTPHFDLASVVPDALPAEVALCLSMKCSPTVAPDVPLRRKRGRVYIGPLGGGTEIYNIAPYSTPTTYLRATLLAAAQGLVSRLVADALNVVWGIYSRKVPGIKTEEQTEADLNAAARDGLFFPLMGEGEYGNVWVDNEWDTQRRRGAAATIRDIADLHA